MCCDITTCELACGASGMEPPPHAFLPTRISVFQVYKALLNEVTEVAVKRLEASSDNQRALFLREIDIHKRCRSVSFYTA